MQLPDLMSHVVKKLTPELHFKIIIWADRLFFFDKEKDYIYIYINIK